MNIENKYLIIEDSILVCEGIANRMATYKHWLQCKFAHHVNDAKDVISAEKPLLIFMDWSLKGGSAFEILAYIQNIQNYNPYIIFNTGFQSDNPEIPQEIINNYKVDKYLVKPIWEKLRLHLPEYLKEAEFKAQTEKNFSNIFLTDRHKNKEKINIHSIICICIDGIDCTIKSIYMNNGNSIQLKINWQQIIDLLNQYKLEFFITNCKQHIVLKKFIQKYHRPYIYLEGFPRKIEVVKDRLSSFEKWLKV